MNTHAQARSDATVRDLAAVAVFTALIAALSVMPAIALGVGPVPITLQTLAVSLTAAVLGPRRAVLAVLAYLLLVAIGLPLAAGMRGGPGVLLGPTGGFLLGFLLMAPVTGALSRAVLRRAGRGARSEARSRTLVVVGLTGAVLAGLVPVYVVGVLQLSVVTGMSLSAALLAGFLPFLPGDLIKAVLSALVTAGVARALPDLTRERA